MKAKSVKSENRPLYAFPGDFQADEAYGAKWWGYIQVTMTDLLWQAPHPPCGFVKADGSETLSWKMDDGTCQADYDDVDPLSGATVHHKFYAHAPQVEARLTVPCNYGQNQNECAPALPNGIQIGWLSPVMNNAGDVAYPPIPPGADSTGSPLNANTAYYLHTLFCADLGAGCRFNYNVPGC